MLFAVQIVVIEPLPPGDAWTAGPRRLFGGSSTEPLDPPNLAALERSFSAIV
jgi:hypothetical protein